MRVGRKIALYATIVGKQAYQAMEDAGVQGFLEELSYRVDLTLDDAIRLAQERGPEVVEYVKIQIHNLQSSEGKGIDERIKDLSTPTESPEPEMIYQQRLKRLSKRDPVQTMNGGELNQTYLSDNNTDNLFSLRLKKQVTGTNDKKIKIL